MLLSSHKYFCWFQLDKIILAKWFNMMDAGNVFNYKLDALETRVCSGKHFSLSLSHTTHTHTHLMYLTLYSSSLVRALKHYSSTTYIDLQFSNLQSIKLVKCRTKLLIIVLAIIL